MKLSNTMKHDAIEQARHCGSLISHLAVFRKVLEHHEGDIMYKGHCFAVMSDNSFFAVRKDAVSGAIVAYDDAADYLSFAGNYITGMFNQTAILELIRDSYIGAIDFVDFPEMQIHCCDGSRVCFNGERWVTL